MQTFSKRAAWRAEAQASAAFSSFQAARLAAAEKGGAADGAWGRGVLRTASEAA